MKILFIGDIFGKPGREIVRRGLPALDRAARRSTSSSPTARTPRRDSASPATSPTSLFGYGIDVMTSGNHVWDKKEVLDYIPRQPKLLRPANFPAGVPGRGAYLGRTRTGEPVGVVNVMGRVFMTPLDDPFAVVLQEIEALRAKTRVIIVDFHAEATSEKVAMGVAPRRPRDRRPRHAHPRADGRRAHPAQRHGLPDRRRHDRPARLDHRRHRRGRARPVPQRHAGEVRGGQRPWPAERGRDHRRPGDRQGDGDRTAEPVAPGGRGAGQRPLPIPTR